MKSLSIGLILLSLVSCGMKVETEIPDTTQTVNTKVSIDIGLEEMATFCDERYGDEINSSTGDLKAEECFQDALQFTQINLELGTEIPSYCESQFNTQDEITACENELLLLMQ